MGQEIERKFLVNGDEWRSGKVAHTCQGYLVTGNDTTVRVRLKDDKGYLTIKGKAEGISRLEYEYEIPIADAKDIMDRLCMKPLIEKKRYEVEHLGILWEVDEFFGENEGLIVAEVELESEDQQVELPSWVGKEVSDDRRYSNLSLVRYPFSQWKKE